ncbi:MAG: cupredoxin family protein [Rubrivivax sp.]|nr:cupredoxin family protein [Rubrivivax sp.]
MTGLKGRLAATMVATLATVSAAAWAHGDKAHAGPVGPVVKEQKDWGIAGNAKAVTRTVQIGMSDAMRFTPDRIELRQGDTVRFVVRNTGKLMHEFVIGTKKELDEHAALMLKFPNMEHDEPYMAHVPAGRTGEVVWTFNRVGDFDFACLIAGHYQAGMVGRIQVAPVAAAAAGTGAATRKP